MIDGTRYFVYFTPRTGYDTYGDEVDVSDFITRNVGNISRNIDAGEYDIGLYAFSDLQLVGENGEGKLNDEGDARSIFLYSRDLAKVRIVWEDADGARITFRGLIFDEATRLNAKDDLVTFKVLGRDSVIKKATVREGLISDGLSVQQAIINILNSDEITRVLTFNSSNINCAFNPVVTVGSVFDNKNKKEALEELLFVANSVLLISDTDEVIVTSRTENTLVDTLELFGAGDIHGRENIYGIEDYNNGLQRVFNSIKINDTVERDASSIEAYGLRQSEISLDWLTDTTVLSTVCSAILSQWRYPKIELNVSMPTSVADGADILHRVSLDHPLRLTPAGGFFPVEGVTMEATARFPYEFGSLIVEPTIAFKIVEIVEQVRDFVTTLKLRQVGTTNSDGFF